MLLGRTNTEYPRSWAGLGVSADTTPQELIEAVRPMRVPLDISSQPALWGGFLRGGEDVLIQRSTTQFERATSQDHATDLIQAHLIETLSSIGRETIDFYFLRVRRVVEEFQINGALAALEFAKQEGHIRHIGLMADGPALAVQSVWQFHDAFEVLLASMGDTALKALARERRVGVVAYGSETVDEEAHATILPVRSLRDLETLRQGMGANA